MFAFLHFAFVIHDTNPFSNIVFLVFITPVENFIEIKYDYEFRNKNFMTDVDTKRIHYKNSC